MPELNPVQHPLGPPALSGNTITIDMLLKQPTRITKILMDLTLQRFIADRIFTNAGGVTGGAVVFDQATENELYLDRDVERVEPGDEFPVVTSQRRAPSIARVEKWGGKYYYTDEAKDRNDEATFQNELRKLANTIVRKINQRAVEVLEAAITANGGLSNMTSVTSGIGGWGAVLLDGNAPTPPSNRIHADFAKVQLLADQRELGLIFDLWLVNPQELTDAKIVYGEKWGQVLADNGIKEVYASNRVTAGTAYAIASGQAGQMRVEQPLATETVREGAPLLRQRTWVQSSVRPLMFVDNPFAVVKVSGV